MDPFSLLAFGLGTAGSLYGGIKNAIEGPERKREFLRERQRQAQMLAARNSRMSDFYGREPVDFWGDRATQAQLVRNADMRQAEQIGQPDPMTFLPFVQNATQLAGGIYDAASGPSKPVPTRSGARMSMSDFIEPEGYSTRGPSSGARLSVDDFYDPEELRYFGGRR